MGQAPIDVASAFFWVVHRHFSGLFIGIFLGIFDSLGFKSAAWVSDRWLGFANWWLGWWVWWPLLAPTGLCVCVSLLMVCVCVCVWLCVCGDGFG